MLFKNIYRRLVKGIEIYGAERLKMSKTTILNNKSVIRADQKSNIILGDNVRIGSNSEINSSENTTLIIKDYSTLYSNCKVLGNVTIERYCVLATNIYMSSGQHYAFHVPELLIREQDSLIQNNEVLKQKHHKKITLEEDVWIGNGVFIAAGITIGRGAVIGAGAIVTKDISPYSVVVGNPAKELKQRLKFAIPNQLDASLIHHYPYFYRGFDHKLILKQDKGFKIIDKALLKCKSDSGKYILKGNNLERSNVKIILSSTKEFCFIVNKGFFTLELDFKKINTDINISIDNIENYDVRILSIKAI